MLVYSKPTAIEEWGTAQDKDCGGGTGAFHQRKRRMANRTVLARSSARVSLVKMIFMTLRTRQLKLPLHRRACSLRLQAFTLAIRMLALTSSCCAGTSVGTRSAAMFTAFRRCAVASGVCAFCEVLLQIV